ncbi:hypothetical protein S7711_08255 [Stachybotrys chartarum IBT 7711]|uniref:Inner kinetochore subunit AME1 domain-containing protein n=1 Tax=Stachybotrys chartarum (strain CBS 109288 / IBT 7711) TaxID=1280523 RepID=A0A084AQK3_STACB|nr:hypothetical protein S7711_08255 [Stachybotrys chartarum IBT 7711]KFA56090.1 hypothetical protein S40293_00177 [Stachybotrys chartarum IBT 40293]
MATGREARAERLNERLRGAQRVNVEDESFSIDIGGFALPVEPAPAPAETPSSPNKRRRLNGDAAPSSSRTRSSTRRRSDRTAEKSPYDIPDSSKESGGEVSQAAPSVQSSTKRSSARTARTRISAAAESIPEEDALEQLPAAPGLLSPDQRRRSGKTVQEEVTESPIDAPGSGHRVRVQSSAIGNLSERLQDVLASDDAVPASSSPLVRKMRRRSTMGPRESQVADPLSPQPRREELEIDDSVVDDAQEATLVEEQHSEPQVEPAEDAEQTEEEEPAEEEQTVGEEDHEVAEEIGVDEAARRIGRKRPRVSLGRASPELGSSLLEQEEETREESAPKRRRGRPINSPVTQKQPQAKKTKTAPASAIEARPKAHAKTTKKSRRRSDDADDPAIEITVQGFVHNKKPNEDDVLDSGIPYANRGGESVVDVFAQVCEEVIASALAQFEQLAADATDNAKRKEYRVKMRAVEAYREELSSRLLEHAIRINHWHSLRKRVRHVQKEKLALREEILRLKAEREQVALRMDQVRIKHEDDTKESTYRLNASALMHDIELAVEQGRDAPHLSPAEQKKAELANLELVVAQVAEQASSNSATGGLLAQVRDFNAFLERAAIALETRRE